MPLYLGTLSCLGSCNQPYLSLEECHIAYLQPVRKKGELPDLEGGASRISKGSHKVLILI